MSNSIRQKRVEENYRHALSNIMLFEVDHEDLVGVSVTQVVFTPDLKLAKIYFVTTSGRAGEKKALNGFDKTKNFFRRRLGEESPLKFVPDLRFYYDESEDVRASMDALFKKIEGERHGQGEEH